MAARSIWNGTVAFGLMSVPVKLHTATESKTVHFREVHLDDGAKIEHRRFCSKEDTEVGFEEVGHGYDRDDLITIDKTAHMQPLVILHAAAEANAFRRVFFLQTSDGSH